jgi:TonB family protein
LFITNLKPRKAKLNVSYNGENNLSGSVASATALRRPIHEISLKKSLLISTGMHFATPLLLWLIVFLLALLGISLLIFEPPKPKVRDIEFKIVQAPEQKPLTDTKNRAERDTRAGGKHDPTKPESEPQPKAASSPQPAAQPQPKPQPKAQPKPQPQPKAQPKPQPKPQPQPKAQQPPQPQPQQQPPMPVPPKLKSPTPKAPPNPLAPPVKIASAPVASGPSTSVGPVTSSSTSSSGSGSSGPAPVTLNSPSVASSSGGGGYPGTSGSPSSGSSSYGSGNPGNPSAGNPSGAPGINARKDPDFGPYMSELQRRIKRNWQPPRRNQSKRVILLFTVAKDGRLLNLRVYKTSGEPDTDKAAISAVQLSAPFKPLPNEFSGSSIDIQFAFDYNVFGVGGRSF